ncbi:MAG: hypothetical protein JNM95_12920 [Chitinophagaceae bacterium]|nr:hypothetical protein [Chitinophagaceae bacterium]
MRLLLPVLVLLVIPMLLTGKTNSYFLSGLGNYEGLYVGFQKEYKSKWYWEGSLGLNPFQPQYQMLYVASGYPLLTHKKKPIVLYAQVKALCWNFSNQYNHFLVFTPDLELRCRYNRNKLKLALTAGYVYNTPLIYTRKTNLEVGWLNEWQPSFSLQTQFRLR